MACANFVEAVGRTDMAERKSGGAIEGDEEKPEVEAPEPQLSTEAVAATVAAALGANDPEVARNISAFLKKQTELVATQKTHLRAEHPLRLANLLGQKREGDLRRIGMWIRMVLLVVAAVLIGVAIRVMVHDAAISRSVVIEPFEAPPTLAADGLNGKVLAAGLLDVLTGIQEANRSNMKARSLSNAWSNDIAIEVPETHISIGQLEQMLKARFGHDLHIYGDLVQSKEGGLALTVRGTGILPKTFPGQAGELNKLLTQAGEYVYSNSQPAGLWVSYLTINNRNDEALRFAQRAYIRVAPSERPDLLIAWANAISANGGKGAMAETLLLYREAVRLKPDYWIGYTNIMYALGGLGDDEGVVREGEQLMEIAGGRPGRAPEDAYQNYDEEVWDLPAVSAAQVADMESHGGIGTLGGNSPAENLTVAQYEVQMHNIDAAKLRLKTTLVDEKNVSDVAASAMDRALLAEELGDLNAGAKEWEAFEVAYSDPTVSTSNPPNICYAAVTYEKTGQPGKADAALDAVGKLTFVDCYRFRGDLVELRGDWPRAQEWYAKAVKLGPSIPSGYYSWGVALAKHGDFDAAAAKFNDANQKGPHWADPLKAWGDLLAKQGKTKDALAKYKEALKYAPNWNALKTARDALTKQKS